MNVSQAWWKDPYVKSWHYHSLINPLNINFLGMCISSRCCMLRHSVASNSLWPPAEDPPGSSVHGHSPGKNTGVGCHALQGIFPTQGSNTGLPLCRWILYHLSHQGRQSGTNQEVEDRFLLSEKHPDLAANTIPLGFVGGTSVKEPAGRRRSKRWGSIPGEYNKY